MLEGKRSKKSTLIDDNVLQNISFFIWQFSKREFSKLGIQLSLGMNREEFLRVCSQFLYNKNVIHKHYSDNIIHTIRMVTTRAGLFLYWYILLFLSKLSRRVIGFSKLDNWHHTQLTLLHQFKMTLEEYVSKKICFTRRIHAKIWNLFLSNQFTSQINLTYPAELVCFSASCA